MAIGIVEMLTRIGDDRIAFQNLDQCYITADWNHKKGTRITFGTEESLGPNGTERLGLVVWLDRDLVKEVLTPAPTGGQSDE